MWKRVRDRLVDPARFAGRTAPPFPGCDWTLSRVPLAPGVPSNTTDALTDGRFSFVGHDVSLGWPPRWDCFDQSRLWQYNLHYFDWIWALDYEAAKEAAGDWIRRHDLARNRVGWEPFPVSLRLQNWLAVFFGRYRERTENDPDWIATLWPSVWLQTEWLQRNLEHHLLANHLLENAVALTWAGACFRGTDAARWFDQGYRLLDREIDEQILPDGMHYERSAMYHLRAVYLVEMLDCLERPDLRNRLAPVLRRMLEATDKLLHADGQIALVNDSAFGIANDPGPLLETGRALLGDDDDRRSGNGPWSLPDAGYYGFRDDGVYLICDAGPVGPDYMPGHAHGDLLSFELSVGGRRIIVDSGVYSYETDEMRSYCRSTRAHNTVEIDGQDQCEFWGAFRVGRRGRPSYVDWEASDEGIRLACGHDGYSRLAGSPSHQRTFQYDRSGRLEVEDRIVSSRPVRVVSRLHLHPECTVEQLTDVTAIIVRGDDRLRLRWSGAVDELVHEDSWYCPRFGLRQDNVALACLSYGSRIDTTVRIEWL
jgi:uncharacterized heparinase superfamily protein